MRIDPCSVPVRKGSGYCYFWDDITLPDCTLFHMCSHDDGMEFRVCGFIEVVTNVCV